MKNFLKLLSLSVCSLWLLHSPFLTNSLSLSLLSLSLSLTLSFTLFLFLQVAEALWLGQDWFDHLSILMPIPTTRSASGSLIRKKATWSRLTSCRLPLKETPVYMTLWRWISVTVLFFLHFFLIQCDGILCVFAYIVINNSVFFSLSRWGMAPCPALLSSGNTAVLQFLLCTSPLSPPCTSDSRLMHLLTTLALKPPMILP